MVLLVALGGLCVSAFTQAEQDVRVAFMPDIHFHNVYGDFQDKQFSGVKNPLNGKPATIRTMAAQLKSTRLFNESYFALRAALDDVVKRGVKFVALPGDFSDNGQPLHMRGLLKVLQYYERHHGLMFFAAPGNHDPVRPYTRPAGADDFLGRDGHPQAIYSPGSAACPRKGKARAGVICSEEVAELGYREIIGHLETMGFMPRPNYLHWETPFDYVSLKSKGPSNYGYKQALSKAELTQRQYQICQQKHEQKICQQQIDASYLVEPVPGLWLLSIDANVYVPESIDADGNVKSAGSGNAGYKAVLKHKPFLLDWIRDVAKRAEQQGKTLLSFSHFPMVEFYDNRSDLINTAFVPGSMQMQRRPGEEVSHQLAKTGLRVHIAGHMHINDTGLRRYSDGHYLLNIQAPSLAAYVPAYKLLSVKAGRKLDVKTIVLEDVPDFDQLFELYRFERRQLLVAGKPAWDASILDAKNYREFAKHHLHGLVEQRFLDNDWPNDIRQSMLHWNGLDLLSFNFLMLESETSKLEDWRASKAWQQARKLVKAFCKRQGMNCRDYERWRFKDFVHDLYRLRNADSLALDDIGQSRMNQYLFLSKAAKARLYTQASKPFNNAAYKDLLTRMAYIYDVFEGFSEGQASNHFELDLATGFVTRQ